MDQTASVAPVAPVAPQAPASVPPTIDGRNRRRTQNMDVVVDAMLRLLADGNPWPTAADVAARAGLSERSVYRYFVDLDTLARAAVDMQIQRADHLFQPLAVDGSLDERIDRLVAHRVAVYDQVGPIVQAARVRSALHAAIAEGLAHRRRQLRAQLKQLFAAELAGAAEGDGDGDRLTALEVATGFEALHALRVDRGLPAARTTRILRRMVAALLAADPAPRKAAR